MPWKKLQSQTYKCLEGVAKRRNCPITSRKCACSALNSRLRLPFLFWNTRALVKNTQLVFEIVVNCKQSCKTVARCWLTEIYLHSGREWVFFARGHVALDGTRRAFIPILTLLSGVFRRFYSLPCPSLALPPWESRPVVEPRGASDHRKLGDGGVR